MGILTKSKSWFLITGLRCEVGDRTDEFKISQKKLTKTLKLVLPEFHHDATIRQQIGYQH
jgi:hypothetical protein